MYAQSKDYVVPMQIRMKLALKSSGVDLPVPNFIETF
jgi:hypothetical protein